MLGIATGKLLQPNGIVSITAHIPSPSQGKTGLMSAQLQQRQKGLVTGGKKGTQTFFFL